jgi:hypothetical protein
VGAEKLPGNVVGGGEWAVRPSLRVWEGLALLALNYRFLVLWTLHVLLILFTQNSPS